MACGCTKTAEQRAQVRKEQAARRQAAREERLAKATQRVATTITAKK